MILSTALMCLTANIYYEARADGTLSELAVAQVTMNRAWRDPKRVCMVVSEEGQFSWTDARMKIAGRAHGVLILRRPIRDQYAWKRALTLAKYTLKGYVGDFTHGAAYYHTDRVNPRWDDDMTLVGAYGHHLFFFSFIDTDK